MTDVAIYGAGGFGREVAATLLNINRRESKSCNFLGFFDDGMDVGAENEYGKVLGGLETLNKWRKELSIFIAIGNPLSVKSIVNKIHNQYISFPNLVNDSEFLDKNNSSIGIGNIIIGRCFMSCNTHIGNFNIFNHFVSVGHDTTIGSYNSFMPSARISGNVQIGDENFFGVGSIVLQQISIGNNIKLGAGSVLMHKPKDKSLYIGNPAKLFKF